MSAVLGKEQLDLYYTKQMEMLSKKFDEIPEKHRRIGILLAHSPSPDSLSYFRAITKNCKELGIRIEKPYIKDESTSPILYILEKGNVIPQFIDPMQDIDCIGDHNPCYESPIGQGICDYLDSIVRLNGCKIVIVGRGKRAGLPIIQSLLKRGATFTACNSKTGTRFLCDMIQDCDIFISAIDKPEYFSTPTIFPEGGIVVDCGCCWSDKKQKLVGNCSEEALQEANLYSLVPFIGGTGRLTRISLLKNAYRYMYYISHEKQFDENWSNKQPVL